MLKKTLKCFHCREKLHGLEYPPGERIIIRPVVASDKKQNQEKLFPFEGPSKELFCSVTLPAAAPLAKSEAPCAQRCFIVCVPKVTSEVKKKKRK